MINPNSNKKFISMFILLIWLAIFVFFTQDIYSSLMDKIETNEKIKEIQDKKIILRDKLSEKAKELKINKWDSEVNKEISKYLQEYSEDRIINLIYDFSSSYSKNWQILIKNIKMSEWKENEIWFKEAKINISARVSNKKVMIDFLNFVIENEEYKFFIDSFNVPKKTNVPFNIQLPIKVFYKDFKKVEK